MEYKGGLYGKTAAGYWPLQMTADDVDDLSALAEGLKESALGKDKEIADLKKQNDRLREALEDLKDRADRTRNILKEKAGNPQSWMILETSKATQALKTSKQ